MTVGPFITPTFDDEDVSVGSSGYMAQAHSLLVAASPALVLLVYPDRPLGLEASKRCFVQHQ